MLGSRLRALFPLFPLLVACGSAPARAPLGSTFYPPTADRASKTAPAKPPDVPDDIVARAAQPFRAQRNADSHEIGGRERAEHAGDALAIAVEPEKQNDEDNAVLIPFRTAQKVAPARGWILFIIQARSGQLMAALAH